MKKTDLLSVVIVLAMSLTLTGAQLHTNAERANFWEFRASMPEARKGAAAVVWGEHIYVIGGVNEAGEATERVDRYHPETDTWDTMPSLRIPRSNAAAVVWEGTLIVIGGHGDGDVILHDVEQYDPQTEQWSTFAALTEPREGLTAIVLDNRLYAIGGSGSAGQFFDSVVSYEAASAVWQDATDWQLDRARASFAALSVMDSVYLLGGFNTFGPLGLVQRYQPGSGLMPLAPLVPARGGLGAAYLDSRLYAIGGLTASNEVIASVAVYDVAENAWQLDASLNTARSQFPAVTYNGVIYVFGGEIADEQVIGSVEAFISGTAPVANDDTFITGEDVILTMNVISNDASPGGEALTITSYTKPLHGTIQEGNLPGNFVYTPDVNYFGPDQFTYTIRNIDGESSSATVSITVEAVNDPPVFTSMPTTAGLVDERYAYEVRADDVDNTLIFIEADLQPAWLQFTDQQNGTAILSGTPSTQDAGVHRVILRVNDGDASSEQSFEITVLAGVPTAPQLIAPSNAVNEVPGSVELRWESEGATAWDLQVATDSLFTELVEDIAGLVVKRFEVRELERLTTYYWRVRASNSAGSSDWSLPFQFTTVSNVSTEAISLPERTFSLKTPYPNPFTSHVTLSFEVLDVAHQPIRVAIYTVEGRMVNVLHHGPLATGEHTVLWDGTDRSGMPVASGSYLIHIIHNQQQLSRSLVLVR